MLIREWLLSESKMSVGQVESLSYSKESLAFDVM